MFEHHQLKRKVGTDNGNPDQLMLYCAKTKISRSQELEHDFKRPRACETCRALKVRCDQDVNHPGQPCTRCAKAQRRCVVTPPSRKRQRKSESKVVELEKKIDALTATLLSKQHSGPSSTLPMSPQRESSDATSPHVRTSGNSPSNERTVPKMAIAALLPDECDCSNGPEAPHGIKRRRGQDMNLDTHDNVHFTDISTKRLKTYNSRIPSARVLIILMRLPTTILVLMRLYEVSLTMIQQ